MIKTKLVLMAITLVFSSLTFAVNDCENSTLKNTKWSGSTQDGKQSMTLIVNKQMSWIAIISDETSVKTLTGNGVVVEKDGDENFASLLKITCSKTGDNYTEENYGGVDDLRIEESAGVTYLVLEDGSEMELTKAAF